MGVTTFGFYLLSIWLVYQHWCNLVNTNQNNKQKHVYSVLSSTKWYWLIDIMWDCEQVVKVAVLTGKTLYFRCMLWNVEISLHFNLAFSQCSTSIYQAFDGQTGYLILRFYPTHEICKTCFSVLLFFHMQPLLKMFCKCFMLFLPYPLPCCFTLHAVWLCVNADCDDGVVVCRYNSEKTLSWLRLKVWWQLWL